MMLVEQLRKPRKENNINHGTGPSDCRISVLRHVLNN